MLCYVPIFYIPLISFFVLAIAEFTIVPAPPHTTLYQLHAMSQGNLLRGIVIWSDALQSVD